MLATILLLQALVGIARVKSPPQFLPDEWNASEGRGEVAFWLVNATCNRLCVVPRHGSVRRYRLRQFEFENGDHFLQSALALDAHHLVVTHQHGLYEIDDRGRVVCQDSGQPRRLITVDGRRVIASQESNGTWVDGRTSQAPLDWNGIRLLTKVAGEKSNSVSLFTKGLRFVSMIWPEGENVLTCHELGRDGWAIDLAKEEDPDVRWTVWLSNSGKISFDRGAHWH